LQQCPELCQIILEGCTREQEAPEGSEHKQDIPPLRLEVFDHMRFVEYHIIPRLPFEDMGISTGQRIGSDTDIEMVFIVPALSKFFASFRTTMITENLETR